MGGSLFGDVRVFAHASVNIAADEAVELLDEVRRRTGAGPGEVKASRLRQPWTRSVAAWLCGPEGQLRDRAVVHVTDTRLFGLARLAQVVASDSMPEGWWSADQDRRAWDLARRLDGLVAGLPRTQERRFLLGARDLLWLTRRMRPRAPVEIWTDMVAAAAAWFDNADDRRLVAGLASPAAVQRAGHYLAAPPTAPPPNPSFQRCAGRCTTGAPWVTRHRARRAVRSRRLGWQPSPPISRPLTPAAASRVSPGSTRVRTPRVQVADLVVGVVRRSVEARLTGPPGVATGRSTTWSRTPPLSPARPAATRRPAAEGTRRMRASTPRGAGAPSG